MEKSFVFDAVLVDGVYDRQYLSSDFCNYFGSFISNGVFPNPSTNLQVTASKNFDVTIMAGRAFINGRTYHNTDKLLFTLDVADGVLNRIDTVVVQVNHLAREIKTVIKKGTFAVNPIPPELTNNADYEEIQLAEIYIKAGAINITQADITDTRIDNKVCGIVHGTVDQIDTTTLFNQYKSWYEQTTKKAVDDIQAFQTQFKSDAIAWVDSLKDIFGKDAAINLLNLINELKSEIDTKFTETNKAITELKSTTYTKSQTDLTRTYTLAHSKSGAVHTLSDLPTTNGIYQCQFVATANYVEGETFSDGYTAKPNGEETKLPDKAFVTGDLVNVVVDTERKKLGFKLGGGGGYGTLSPQIRNFTAKAGNHQITLNWTNPSDSNFAGLYLVRKQGSMPAKLSDGTKIDVGKATSYTDKEPENGKIYYYRAFPYNAKKQVQTELTGAVVSAMPKAFQLPRFTGQHAIFGNENEGRLEMYSSGTLTVEDGVYDLFCVGGGGGSCYNDSEAPSGGQTELFQCIALGGISGLNINKAGDGGSGGGGYNGGRNCAGGTGGTNGSNGENNGGKGSGISTICPFNNVLYAGGGAGGSNYTYGLEGIGGKGGGGNGGHGPGGHGGENGVINTGGGGGGAYQYTNDDYGSKSGGSGGGGGGYVKQINKYQSTQSCVSVVVGSGAGPYQKGGSGIAIIHWKRA